MSAGVSSPGTGRPELRELLGSAHIPQRLRYAESLIELMEGRDDEEQHALTGGAAMWLGAIDETLAGANPTVGGAGYKTRRSQEAGGQTLIALRLARNEMAHGEALVTDTGARAPFRIPLLLFLRFMPADELSDHFEERNPGKVLRAHDLRLYEEHVSEQRPPAVLRRAAGWLAGIVAEGSGAAPPAGNSTAPGE